MRAFPCVYHPERSESRQQLAQSKNLRFATLVGARTRSIRQLR